MKDDKLGYTISESIYYHFLMKQLWDDDEPEIYTEMDGMEIKS